jgi:ATPase subunit of ABC transporter with duplicated ATPase domains
VLVISHDRYFLDRTVDRILELNDAHITEYIGGYSDYAQKTDQAL